VLTTGCSLLPTKVVYKDRVVEVVKLVPTPVTYYVRPPETERGLFTSPKLQGDTWKDVLVLVGDYNDVISQCNYRIKRIWIAVDSYEK
jgi:hypothetical protein